MAVPANELWAVDVLRISAGYLDHQPYLGKAWDWVDVRFALLPDPQEHTPENNVVFRDPKGSHIMLIRIMLPLGGDGDPRKDWRSARLEPDDENYAGIEVAQTLHVKPLAIVASHPELGLEEYAPWGEFYSTFFRSGTTIIRCWDPPFSPISHVCESSFNLSNGLLVVVMFPYSHLAQWKNILNFARGRAPGLCNRKPAGVRTKCCKCKTHRRKVSAATSASGRKRICLGYNLIGFARKT